MCTDQASLNVLYGVMCTGNKSSCNSTNCIATCIIIDPRGLHVLVKGAIAADVASLLTSETDTSLPLHAWDLESDMPLSVETPDIMVPTVEAPDNVVLAVGIFRDEAF